MLDLEPGERLGYVIEGNHVRLVNASALEHEDPALEQFLTFLEQDIVEHPEHLRTLPKALVKRARSLSTRVRVDHSASIDGDVGV